MTKRNSTSQEKITILGPNQLSLLKALLYAPGNRFKTLAAWYRSDGVVGGSRESRRQSCWRVIKAGWAVAEWGIRGWECTFTPAGRDIAEGVTKIRILGKKPEPDEKAEDPTKINPMDALRKRLDPAQREDLDRMSRMAQDIIKDNLETSGIDVVLKEWDSSVADFEYFGELYPRPAPQEPCSKPEQPKQKPESTKSTNGTQNPKWAELLASVPDDAATIKSVQPGSNRDLLKLQRLLREACLDWRDTYRRRN